MDATNSGIPAAGGQLSGDSTRQAAIRRMEALQRKKPTGTPPLSVAGSPRGY